MSFAQRYKLQILPIIVLSIIGFTFGIENAASGFSPDTIRIERLDLVDASGQPTKQVQVGQQVSVRATIRNTVEVDKSFVVLIEVRDGSGITEYLAWQGSKLRAGGNYTFETSWIPANGCVGALDICHVSYQLRSFPITGFDNAQVLGSVTTVEGIEVIDDSQNEVTATSIIVDGKEYGIEYSIGSGNIEMITTDSQAGSMMLSFHRIATDTELNITLSKELMDAVFLNWVYTLPSGEKADYTPEFALDTVIVEPISVRERPDSTTWVMSIAPESEELEIFVSAPI